MTNNEEKFENIRQILRGKRILVALSGGVDSSVLAYLATEVGEETQLIHVDSILSPSDDTKHARRIAEDLGIPLDIIKVNHLKEEQVVANSRERCYYCKRHLAEIWKAEADKRNLEIVIEGTNASEMKGHRPGSRALKEAGICSPYIDVGLTKDEIRSFAKKKGISVAERPSMACLATRFPYGIKITHDKVARVAQLEEKVREIFGLDTLRVRYHGDLARVEVGREERQKLFEKELLDHLHESAKELGFTYVTVDAYGYRTGSLDE